MELEFMHRFLTNEEYEHRKTVCTRYFLDELERSKEFQDWKRRKAASQRQRNARTFMAVLTAILLLLLLLLLGVCLIFALQTPNTNHTKANPTPQPISKGAPNSFEDRCAVPRVAPFRLDGEYLRLPLSTKRNQCALGVCGDDRCPVPRASPFRLNQCHPSFEWRTPRTRTDEKDVGQGMPLVTPNGIYMMAGLLVICARIQRLLAGKLGE